jgi:hypothetical protein
VTGTFVLDAPLPAFLREFNDEPALLVSWRLSDGVDVFRGTRPTLTEFKFTTEPGGEIRYWFLDKIFWFHQTHRPQSHREKQDWWVDKIFPGASISTDSDDAFKISVDRGSADDFEVGGSNLNSARVRSSGTPVPEPGILSMMFAGLLGLGLIVGVKRCRGNRLATQA